MESSEPPNPESYLLYIPFFILALASSPSVLFGFVSSVLLLIASALFSGSEVAYFSLAPSDIHKLSNEDSPSSKRILQLKEKPRVLLATILIGNNFVNIAIIINAYYLIRNLFSEEIFTQWGQALQNFIILNQFTPKAIGVGLEFLLTVVAVTFLLVLFGEVAPKIYANINNIRMAKLMSRPLYFLMFLFSPFSKIMVQWSQWIEKKLAIESSANRSMKDDLDKAIELTVSHEQNSKKEIDILKSIVKFGEVSAKQIMRSRVDVAALDINSDFDQVLTTVKESGYSRIPVYEEDFDNVVGILYVKDLLIHLAKEAEFNWKTLIRKDVKFVPESKKINELLKEFQQERTHMAIVVDEFGGSAGLVTLEDVMEEVIGDIRDEFDEEIEVDYEQLDKYNYLFEGKTLLNDMCRVVGMDTDTFDQIRGDADSLAGLLLEFLGRIPKRNSEIRYKEFRFKIIAVNERRIEKIQVTIPKNIKV